MEGYKIATDRIKKMISFYEVSLQVVQEYTTRRKMGHKLDALKDALEAIEKDWVEYGENSENNEV